MEVSGLQDTYDRVLTSLFGSAVPCDCLAPASPLRKGLLHRFLASIQTDGILSLCIASPFAGVFSRFFRDACEYANGVFLPACHARFSACIQRVLNTCLWQVPTAVFERVVSTENR